MDGRRAVRRGILLWLVVSLAGIGIVAVPDDGRQVVRLSEGHGPSPWDLIGIAILLLGWALMLVPLVRARSLIPVPGLVLGVVVAGLAIVAWSVAADIGTWWLLGAFLAAGAQLAAAIAVASGRRPSRRVGRPRRD